MTQDVMLSGVMSSQTSSVAAMTTPVVSVSNIAMPTLSGKLSSLTDNVFVGLQSLGVPSTVSDVAAAARVAETVSATGEFTVLLVYHTDMYIYVHVKLAPAVGVCKVKYDKNVANEL